MSKNSEDLSDDFVASVLSKEASEKNIRYSALGLQAFLPKRSATNAPKPNTRFLRNIVREAGSHNAALLAKEAEESKERLRILHLKEGEKRRGEMGVNGAEGGCKKSRAAQRPDRQIYKVGAKREAQAKRDSARDEGGRVEREKERKRRRSRSREGREGERSKRHRSRSVDKRSRSPGAERERRRHRRGSRSRERKRSGERKRDRSKEHKRSRSDDRREGDSNRYYRHYTSRHHSSKDVDGSRHSHRSRFHERSTDKSKATSPPHRPDKKDRSSDISTKPRSSRPRSPRRRPDESDADRERRRKRRKEMEMTEEPDHSSSHASPDPLLSIIGPAPPPPTRTRGRGTMSGSSAMDARFSEQYNPATDVRPDRNDVGDDWDNAIEAYRDRQKWKALGAEKLRSEGFGEDYITAWENNDTKNTANIKWAKEGVREWDRGKVIEEGEVKVRASWVKD